MGEAVSTAALTVDHFVFYIIIVIIIFITIVFIIIFVTIIVIIIVAITLINNAVRWKTLERSFQNPEANFASLFLFKTPPSRSATSTASLSRFDSIHIVIAFSLSPFLQTLNILRSR